MTITEERTTTRTSGGRTTTRRTRTGAATWVCDNCTAETATLRKRCSECGTSRY